MPAARHEIWAGNTKPTGMRHGAHFDQQPAQIGAEIVPARLGGEDRRKACRSHLSAVWPLILDGDHLMMDLVSGGFLSACPIGMRQVQCKIHVNAELAERKAGCGNSRSSYSIILIKQQTIECFLVVLAALGAEPTS